MRRLLTTACSRLAAAAVVLAGLAFLVVPGRASDDPGRYSMMQTDKGIVRLDKQTGAMSVCADRGGRWSCEGIADDRIALQKEADRLAAENKQLKEELRRLEDIVAQSGAGKPSGPGGPRSERFGFRLPSEEEIDRAMSQFERLMKKFKERLDGLHDRKGTPL